MENVESQLQRIQSGIEDCYTEEDLETKLEDSLEKDEPLTVKLGVDPTATELHIGHAVGLKKLSDFQRLGHRVVLVIGDFTARIGDPSDQDSTRPTLTRQEVEENFQTYLDQVRSILDTDELEVRYNSEWLEEIGLDRWLELSSELTVARFLEHETYRERYESGASIRLHEFQYALLQAYDSIAIEADVELGGTDQTFNFLVTRDLMKREGMEPQVAITTPLLEGLDEQNKMSKSLDNHIAIQEEPYEMFSKLMSVSDPMMINYAECLTDVTESEIKERISSGTHPMEVKKNLAERIVSDLHGEEDVAREAKDRWETVFSEQEVPDDLPQIDVGELQDEDGTVRLMKLVRFCDFADSNNQARRLVEQGAVRINDEKHTDPFEDVKIERGDVFRVGKKRKMVELIPDS